MRILIDIGHPAHVHLFKHFAWKMQEKGHQILFTLREKEFEKHLLEVYGFEYKSFGKKYYSRAGKIFGLVKFGIQEYSAGRGFKPDILLSHGSMYAAHAAFFLRKSHISLEDSGNWEQVKLYLPFTKYVLTPKVLPEDLGPKQIRYNSYHELAYLHKNVYQENNSKKLKLKVPYCIIRFVSWGATHDIGHTGFSAKQKAELIKYLKTKLNVYISSESELPKEYQEYKVQFRPEEMHDALANANLFVGEGATMASEAGVLGTPSIYVNSIPRSYCEDQEQYGLVFNFRNFDGVMDKVTELLSIENVKEEFQKRRLRMLKDKIDVTAFLVWFVEHYPESAKVMKEDSHYQNKFK